MPFPFWDFDMDFKYNCKNCIHHKICKNAWFSEEIEEQFHKCDFKDMKWEEFLYENGFKVNIECINYSEIRPMPKGIELKI